MNKIVTALAFAAISAGVVSAEQATLNAPLQGAFLHENGVDMAVYFDEAETGYSVVATYVARDRFTPSRLTMTLADGEAVSFGLPGEPQAYYEFARSGSDVTISVSPVGTLLASK